MTFIIFKLIMMKENKKIAYIRIFAAMLLIT